ncbi:MAG: SAM-dependent DNA methyltransferase [Anaerolineales bacterium]|nr:SAM-dependent DNA methyltransferase [Anaerolineales bacterium]
MPLSKIKPRITEAMSHNLPKQKRLSIPSTGQTLLGNARIWGSPILIAHQRLIDLLKQKVGLKDCFTVYHLDYDFLIYAYHKTNYQSLTFKLCAAALILNWIMGRTLGALSKDASLMDAELWYRGDNESSQPPISKVLDLLEQDFVLEPLRSLEYGSELVDILPYAVEVFETSEELLEAFGYERKSKKNSGIYYTPSDLSDYIVQQVYNLFHTSQPNRFPTWLDPACGTGIFLRSAFYCVIDNNLQEDASEYLFNNLFGIDISPIALQSAAYCLILAYAHNGSTELQTPKLALESIGSHLVVCDSTTIQDCRKLSSLLPSLSNGADCVVSNPPYIRKSIVQTGQLSLFDISNSPSQTTSQAIYTDFVRMLDLLSDQSDGLGGIVIPLSIAYSSRREFQQLRQFLSIGGRIWRFAHFDRTPDSLFGDDVKTRCTIVLLERSQQKFYYTTHLMRWSSRSRYKLFDGIRFAKVCTSVPICGIPKIGSDFEVTLLELIAENCMGSLGDTIRRTKSLSLDIMRYLRSSRTAYNWLPLNCYRNTLLIMGIVIG